ncbi:HAD family hydrolase [Spongiimicrobium sp. 3-5]|uniref:HAD family hydrolase n=1 Tax=Spongiimicrobium sp. 3-5 TaxID=3332596 RepID=UPI0039801FCA
MIKNIIFDFGDIFIDLDKPATQLQMMRFGYEGLSTKVLKLAMDYEQGLVTTDSFITNMIKFFPKATKKDLIMAWNAIIRYFPDYRLEFIENLATTKRYRLFLLSNTNALHIDQVKHNMGVEKYQRFKNCFEQFYLSHEINLRKPNAEIYQFVLRENGLEAKETFFVDDTKENTLAAERLGIRSWNLKVGQEDVIDLNLKLNYV